MEEEYYQIPSPNYEDGTDDYAEERENSRVKLDY